ncbi:DUF4166 domain-containing protein [Dyella ginsengisoli]|uniref:DUF4166 domain-containing protein n=1 Tax=Dyella ginsengisoli TaxID=363848 RepID=A0ABW8JW98_9GAMM
MAEPIAPESATDDTAVSRWFGSAFGQLHPQLQTLHRRGGTLHGPLTIRFGRGLVGVFGRRLARKLGIPTDGTVHRLQVGIHHLDGRLHWDRRFDDGARFASTFRPYGRWPDGGWIEETGAITLRLQVDVVDGGWQWRCIGARLGRWPLPLWLLPRTHAGKRIEAGDYRFDVSIALPLLGEVLGYGGLLQLADDGDQ